MAYAPRKRKRLKASEMSFLGQSYQTVSGEKRKVTNHFAVPDASEPSSIELCWDETHPGPPYKTGGPFSKISVETPYTQIGKVYRAIDTANFGWSYEGGFCPRPYFGPGEILDTDFPNLGVSGSYDESFLSAEPYGTRAYNSARPRLAEAGADVFLGELKDLPRMLRTTSQGLKDLYQSMRGRSSTPFMDPKRVSDHFLNHVFGWAPFVNDIVKMHEVYKNTDRVIANLVRNNGRWQHRYRVVEQNTSVVLHPREYTPLVQPALNGLLLNPRTFEGHAGCDGFSDYTTQDVDVVWFEGSFKYYVPFFDRGKPGFHSDMNRLAQLITIYGLRVSPATIWKLTPWSWLIDWATNAGDVIDSVVAAGYDHLVSRYAFVMRHRQRINSKFASVFLKNYGDTADLWVQNLDTKDRRVATPFGFAVDMTSLSAKQLAILAALGINRG